MEQEEESRLFWIIHTAAASPGQNFGAGRCLDNDKAVCAGAFSMEDCVLHAVAAAVVIYTCGSAQPSWQFKKLAPTLPARPTR